MKIYAYNEHTGMGGQSVGLNVLVNYDGDVNSAGDWSVYSYANGEEALADVVRIMAGEQNITYKIRLAQTIVEAVLAEFGDVRMWRVVDDRLGSDSEPHTTADILGTADTQNSENEDEDGDYPDDYEPWEITDYGYELCHDGEPVAVLAT